MYVCMYVCMYLRMYMYIYVYVCVCLYCVYIMCIYLIFSFYLFLLKEIDTIVIGREVLIAFSVLFLFIGLILIIFCHWSVPIYTTPNVDWCPKKNV